MRNVIAIIVIFVIAALVYCVFVARRSNKDIAPKVTTFLISLFPPMIGNLIIIISRTENLSLFGRYLYAVGIDITMYCLLGFTLQYCGSRWNKTWQKVVIAFITVDIIQILCNPFFGHAFTPDMMMAYGEPYCNVHSYIGRDLHLLLVYAIMFAVLVTLLINMIKGARIYSEKYSIMFILLLFTGAWEVFYLFTHTPVKLSVITYGVFGLLVFYFSLYYRPMRLLDHLLADVASGLTDGLFFFDKDGRCLWADEHGFRLIGSEDNDTTKVLPRLREMFPDMDFDKSEWKQRNSIEDRYYDLTKHTVYDARNRSIGSFLSVRDDTDNEIALRNERYKANHDPLTGVYTKKYLFDRIRERIDSNPDKDYYIAYIDIDNFKFINDVFGREFGDHTLKVFASELGEKLPPSTLYGRIGSDTFGACIEKEYFDIDKAEMYGSKFIITKDSITHQIEIHEGVYQVTERDILVPLMFDRAHIAMNTIKGDYKRHIVLYDDVMRKKALWDQTITLQLPGALEDKQVKPYLQAIVDKDGNAIGAEALVRWIHPEEGFLSPADFIPVFEKNGMIADVDRYMWRSACEILKRWSDMGRDDLFISVNVSPKDFYFMDVNKELKSIVAEAGVSPSRLRVEITETIMMDDNASNLEILRKLKDDGFMVEMDDFGSGYSSLNMLKNMPVDVIKIDMIFIEDMDKMSKTSTILRNLINMMSELGMVPLTEGVETKEQYHLLSQMGCKLFQGYLFAKPMPVEEFEEQFIEGEQAPEDKETSDA